MKCGSYTLRKGTKVKITSADKTKILGIGKYIGHEDISVFGRKMKTPKFKIGRKIIRGYQCWWIPLSVANEIEKEIV